MDRKELEEKLHEIDADDTLLADGFDEAFLGLAERCSSPRVAVYDYAKCVQILIDREGMSHDEAEEWMSFNVLGAYVGEQTPWFLTRLEE